MNKELFQSMQKQMTPSPEARAELTEKLAQPVKKRPVPWMKYGAVAACAVLVVGGIGAAKTPTWEQILRSFRHDVLEIEIPLHSYVMAENMTSYTTENTPIETSGTGWTPDADWIKNHGEWMPSYDPTTQKGVEGSMLPFIDGGDQDMDMTAAELEQAMLDMGYTQEEINEYQSIGYQITWANWWKFVHQQENSEGDDPFNLDNLKTFSQKELYVRTGALPAPNTGDLPGGAYVGDVPVQAGAEDYQMLMEHFNGTYPDWYGGAYLDQSGRLVVQLVSSKDPGDKSLELQVLDWTGSDMVMFSSCKYSLAQLNALMEQLNALPDADTQCGDVMAGWGIDEAANRIQLTLTAVNDHILSVLAQLDPEDDAIYVQVGQRAIADVGTEDPAVHHVMPGGVTVPDDEDLIAVEPYYDGSEYNLPQQKQPASQVQSARQEDGGTSTPSYDPQA